jgi:hypothetical protein
MRPLATTAIGARLIHGGVVGANRSDRLLRFLRFSPMPDGIDTARRIQP